MATLPSILTVSTQSEAEYAHQQRRWLGPAGLEVRDEPTPAVAHVSEGRWVADCVCNGASLVNPGYEYARCGLCGAVQPLMIPEHYAQIEALLIGRPLGARNWHGESLNDLAVTAPGLGLRGPR